MSLSELASIAEVVGMMLLIPSLIFVGLQIRNGNRETRAATIQATLSSEMAMIAVLTENAAVWDKVLTGQPIAQGEETRTAILLYNLLMTDSENWYLQFRSGYLEPQVWESRLAILPGILSLPFFDVWRATPGARNHSKDFLALVERVSSQAS